MSAIRRLLKKRVAIADAAAPSDELKYNEVPGKQNLLMVSFYENGTKHSVQVETFPDEQIDLFSSLKEQVASFSAMSPQERAKVEQNLFAFE